MKRHNYSNSNSGIDKNRIKILQVFFTIVFISLFAFLFKLQVANTSNVLDAADKQQINIKKPQRGNIYFTDKTGSLISVAINKSYKTIAIDPKTLKRDNQVEIAAKLMSPILNMSEDKLLAIFNKPDSQYEVLVKHTDDDILINKITNLKTKDEKGKEVRIKGLNISEEFERYYPLENVGSQLIGFIAKSQKVDKTVGMYGLEKYYNDTLDGCNGVFSGFKDATGRLIRSLASQEKMSVNGDSLITTIDRNIQYQAEEEIKSLVHSRQASSGAIIAMDPISGKILAMAGYPNYNPNEFFNVSDYIVYRNLAIEEPVEIGSVMKVVTMSAAIDTNSVTPDTTYYDSGTVKIGDRTIHNYENGKFGTVTMTKVLEKSINTGAIFAQKKTGDKIFYDYLKRYKFNDITGIDLPNEQPGDLGNLEGKFVPEVNYATASYGHGILVTPLAILRSYATIANGGYLINPFVVDSIKSPDGSYSSANKQEIINESVIKKETAKTITDMMVSVVEQGYGSKAKVKGYTMAGKTATADIVVDGKYTDDTIQSFAGFFPAYKPRVAMIVLLRKPAIGPTASANVTYGFHNMAQFIIDYYNIPPDEEIKK
jgi:cell division protein FtsI/penicillin-binding protein 2